MTQSHRDADRPEPDDARSITPAEPDPGQNAPTGPAGGQHDRSGRRRETGDPGLRALVGEGRSRLPPGTAMRARDVARPSIDDLAEAERNVVLRRRPWTDSAPTTAVPITTRRQHGR